MRTLLRYGLATLLALAVAGCSSKTTSTTPSTTPTASPTPGSSGISTTVTSSSAGQTVTLTDQTGNVIVLTFPEATGTVLLGTMLTVGVQQTPPTGSPTSTSSGSFDDFLTISVTQSYTLTTPPSLSITGTATFPFAAGTYNVRLAQVGGASYTTLGTATLASNVLTYTAAPPPLSLVAGTTYIIQITM